MINVKDYSLRESVRYMVNDFWNEKVLPVIEKELKDISNKVCELAELTKYGSEKNEHYNDYKKNLYYFEVIKDMKEYILKNN